MRKKIDPSYQWLARSSTNRSLILCTDGEFHHESLVGPSGFTAKLFKTEIGASKTRNGTCLAAHINQNVNRSL